MVNSILVTCIGNICRSPIAERLLKKYAPNKNISSAGLKALVGQSADVLALEVANQHGISLEGHQSKQLTAILCRRYDLILVMEKRHIDAVCYLSPELRGKTMLFGHWLGQCDIADPFHQNREFFESTFRLINESARQWAYALSR